MPSTSSYFYSESQKVIDDIDDQFQLDPNDLIELTKTFLQEFSQGLGEYGRPMAMIPSFVTAVPDGTEKGTFLALDLGGTNLRVCEVVLKGDTTFTLRQQKYKVSDALKTGEAAALFDYIADSVDAFLTAHPPADSPDGKHSGVISLGMTFSFPVEQTALNSGKILTWTKGFSARNAVGHDVVGLLQDAFDRKHLHVKCVALVNDTVGTLLSRSYTGGGCILGAIFGTGTNGAYVEEVGNISKFGNSAAASQGGLMIINCEWGAFNNSRSRLPSTPFDYGLDRRSINPGFQAFEKFISGMYLGEIVRNILLALVDAAPKAILFSGKSTKILNTHYGFDSEVMSHVETAWEGDKPTTSPGKPDIKNFDEGKLDAGTKERLERVRVAVAKGLGFDQKDVTLKDARIVHWACALVARRAALLSGMAVAAVLLQTGRAGFADASGGFTAKNRIEEEKINVGVDGSLVEHYPHFQEILRESLRDVVGERIEKKVVIGLAKDGSGVGAALCALVASRK